MARGKHKRSKESRDRVALEAAIVTTRAELAYEQSLLASARFAASQADSARLALGQAADERDRACAHEIRRTKEATAAVTEVLRATDQQESIANKAWERYIGEVFAQVGSGIDGSERILSLVSGDPEAMMSSGVHYKENFERDVTETIQRARGERRLGRLRATPEQKQRIDDAFKSFGVKEPGDEPLIAARLRSEPLPVLDFTTVAEGPTARALGAVADSYTHSETPLAALPDDPAMVLTAAVRDSLAASRHVNEIVDAWSRPLTEQYVDVIPKTQISGPQKTPEFPAPPDAISLRAWYAGTSWGRWVRSDDTIGVAHRRTTVAATAAVPFWLPPGHTRSYLDSDPLSADDVADLRLPYPNTFLALADPITLPAPDPHPSDPLLRDRLAWLEEAGNSLAREGNELSGLRSLLSLATCGFNQPLLDIATVLRHWDSRIEGVLLLGDALGNVDDLFAWCIAVTTPGGNILARLMISARLSSTVYRQQVLNLAAVVAWGDWHEPQNLLDAPDGVHGETGEEPTPQRADQAVRILNVKAIRSAEHSATTTGEGSSIAPHIRRGHWRRQRYGTKRSLVRRVRIAPTLVNATKGSIAARVYALPKPTEAAKP